jgi:hypothetical protein
MKDDYMKYWRVVRRWVKAQHGMGVQEMEMMLFLYSEEYFGHDNFKEYDQIFSWDNKRFQNMVTDGTIVKFRNAQGGKKALYQLSHKSKGICKSIYKKLNGEETFSECRTEIFQKDPAYMNRQYRKYMMKLNKVILASQGRL